MEAVSEAAVTLETGVGNDTRGLARPGRSTRRQVSILRLEDWETVEAELGTGLVWTTRRANLLVSGLRLPQRAGDYLYVGAGVKLEITGECDPCRRMDEQHQGLMAALVPDWRGGVLARVVTAGHIAIGDAVRIEAT